MIFMESNENIGILYDSYAKLLNITKGFLDQMEVAIQQLRKDPEHMDTASVQKSIQDYKTAMQQDQMVPADIVPSQIRKRLKDCRKFQKDLEKVLNRYAKMKDKIAFGGNYIRGVVRKPKVMTNDIDANRHAVINEAIRTINLGMDWIEKYLIDLFNLNDQDMNIIEIVNRVYLKQKIYESVGETLYRIEKNGKDIYTAYAETCTTSEYARFTDKMGSWLPTWQEGTVYFTQEGYERFFESVWPHMQIRLGDCEVITSLVDPDMEVLESDFHHLVVAKEESA